MRALERIALAIVALSLVAGCGDESSGTDQTGGDEPVTPGALAFVAAAHAGEPASSTPSEDLDELGDRAVGVELRYGSDGEGDGDMLLIGVGKTEGAMSEEFSTDCEAKVNDYLDGCEQTDAGVLMWEDEEPEEDPGVLLVLVEKGEALVLVAYAGPTLTDGKDPRDLDLPISVETLFDIATDPRVDLTTSQAAIDGGQDAGYAD